VSVRCILTTTHDPTIAGLMAPHTTEFVAVQNPSAASSPHATSSDARDCPEGSRRSFAAEIGGQPHPRVHCHWPTHITREWLKCQSALRLPATLNQPTAGPPSLVIGSHFPAPSALLDATTRRKRSSQPVRPRRSGWNQTLQVRQREAFEEHQVEADCGRVVEWMLIAVCTAASVMR
jgi:hypothetical protein